MRLLPLRRAFMGPVAALAGLWLGACGSSPATPETSPSTTAPAATSSSPATTTTAPAALSTLRVYFLRVDKLAVASRTVPGTPGVASAAVGALLAGPTPAERATGLGSAIPAGTALRGVRISDGTATVDLSGTFASGGGSLSMTARLAQVTYTLTQFPTVSGVLFRLDGRPVTVFGGEGIVLDHPATRAGFESVTPAILVESPTPGARVTSPLRVWGTANVFEAAFRVQLTDGSGHVLASQAVRATSGTGTRGTFDVTVPFTTRGGAVTLDVFDLSARDGSRQDVVAVPLEAG